MLTANFLKPHCSLFAIWLGRHPRILSIYQKGYHLEYINDILISADLQISQGDDQSHGCFAYKQLLYFKQQYMVIVTTVFTIHIHCTDNHCSCRGKIEFIVDTVKKSV